MSAGVPNVISRAAQRRLLPLIEIAGAYGLLECALWSRGLSQAAWAVATLLCVGLSTWRSSRNAAALGVGRAGLRTSLWIVPVVALVCGLMILIAWATGSLHGLIGARTPLWHSLLYAIWALVQEFLSMSFIFVRLEETLDGGVAMWITASLFCLAHLPNLALIAATLPMSLAFCWTFRRYRNIYPLAISHAILGLTLSVTFSSACTHFMRVGIAYF